MPLGLLYVAARLEQDGHHVRLVDLQLNRAPVRHLRPILQEFRPQMVGATAFTMNLHKALSILRSIRRLLPHAYLILGGPHVSFDDHEVLRHNPWVDAVVRGEGEVTASELAHSLERGGDPREIMGLTWRDPSGRIRKNPDRPFQEDLSTLPRPAWHLLPLAKYLAFGDGAAVITSRGCPHRCVFCVGRRMIGAKARLRSPSSVVDEMEALALMGFGTVRVEDDLFTLHKERAVAVCREILRRGLSIRWRAYSRVDTVDRELLGWMKRAGCQRILFGVESGSPAILRRIRKGITPEQTRKAVEMTREAGIEVLASFILALPGETPETLRETLAFAESLKVPYSLNMLTPYPGTEVRERAEEWGLRILKHDWRYYGQGKPITATAEVDPPRLRRALADYGRRLNTYLQDLEGRHQRGELTPEENRLLQNSRRQRFLLRLVREELLENYGEVRAGDEKTALRRLVESIHPHMAFPLQEVALHLSTLQQRGLIVIRNSPSSPHRIRWVWAETPPNKGGVG